MIKKRDLYLISHLREDARQSLAEISKKTGTPVTTIYDNLKLHEQKIIKGYVALLDFKRMGFHIRANIALKVSKRGKAKLKDYLMKKAIVNSLYVVNSNYDFMLEVLFKDIKEVEAFTDMIEEKFDIKEKRVYHIIDDLKREHFLSRQEHIKEINHI